MARVFWFAVGTGAGVYGSFKARRLVYRLSPEGLADQAAAIGLGLRSLADDVRDGMTAREEELLAQLGLGQGGARHASRAPGGVTSPPVLAARSHPARRDIP